MTAKRLKKKFMRNLNTTNICLAIFVVLVSFCSVSVCGFVQNQHVSLSKSNDLVYSAARIAEAFEIYNEKRFAQ